MSMYTTWYLVEVSSKGIFMICKTEAERDKAIAELCRRCVEDERWRVDKPTIEVRVNRFCRSDVMIGRYSFG